MSPAPVRTLAWLRLGLVRLGYVVLGFVRLDLICWNMRDFGLPPWCELEICPSVVLHTAELDEERRCVLRHVLCVFMLIALHFFARNIIQSPT